MSWPFASSVREERFDIVQSLYYIDGFGVSVGRRFNRMEHVHYMGSDPFHLGSRLDRYMFERVLRTASAVIVPSRYLKETLEERYGIKPLLIPCGVDTSYFKPVPDKDLKRPRILCMAELGDSRKRVSLLIRAFELLKASFPEAILQLSGRIDPVLARRFWDSVRPDIRESIHFLGVLEEMDIPSLYAHAAVTVLPSIQEAFGMVLIESLSAGTPVVGARIGGIPDVISDPRIGVLFEGEGEEGAKALSTALIRGIELAKDPETVRRCRLHSEPYDWSGIALQHERLYGTLLGIH
jgi:glycosyltransferase involved in cell wall biosynthesis